MRLKSLIYRCENHSQGVTVGNINLKKIWNIANQSQKRCSRPVGTCLIFLYIDNSLNFKDDVNCRNTNFK